MLALLSSCAATAAQRTQLATAIGLTGGKLDVLMQYGVLLRESNGTFSSQDIDAVKSTLALFPDPVVDQLHLRCCSLAQSAAWARAVSSFSRFTPERMSPSHPIPTAGSSRLWVNSRKSSHTKLAT
jgi:hypothetical protein